MAKFSFFVTRKSIEANRIRISTWRRRSRRGKQTTIFHFGREQKIYRSNELFSTVFLVYCGKVRGSCWSANAIEIVFIFQSSCALLCSFVYQWQKFCYAWNSIIKICSEAFQWFPMTHYFIPYWMNAIHCDICIQNSPHTENNFIFCSCAIHKHFKRSLCVRVYRNKSLFWIELCDILEKATCQVNYSFLSYRFNENILRTMKTIDCVHVGNVVLFTIRRKLVKRVIKVPGKIAYARHAATATAPQKKAVTTENGKCHGNQTEKAYSDLCRSRDVRNIFFI